MTSVGRLVDRARGAFIVRAGSSDRTTDGCASMKLMHGLAFDNLWGDVYGGLTAAVVALPLAPSWAKGMARRLAASDDYDALVLEFREVSFLDSSASLGLEDEIKQALRHNKHVFLVGVRPDAAKTLQRLGVLKLLPDTHHHVSRLDALKQAAAMVRA